MPYNDDEEDLDFESQQERAQDEKLTAGFELISGYRAFFTRSQYNRYQEYAYEHPMIQQYQSLAEEVAYLEDLIAAGCGEYLDRLLLAAVKMRTMRPKVFRVVKAWCEQEGIEDAAKEE